MNRVFQIDAFGRFNSFYGKPECRFVVLNLYKGICQSCDAKIVGDAYHVAHIISRTHPTLMEKYFPGLDVDNLLNLQLSCPSCNLKVSNFVLDTPLLLHTFTCSARAISLRLSSVMARLCSESKPVQMSGVDPKICTDVLHISMGELYDISTDWHGAVVISNDKLKDRIRQEMTLALGYEPDDWAVYSTLTEAIGNFKDLIQVNGSRMSWIGVKKPEWWTEAYARRYSRDGSDIPNSTNKDGSIITDDLADGIYLDQDELNGRQGLWIPLRTETQRWFCDVIGTIVRTRRKLETQTDHKRYVVLDEDAWHSLCDCFEQLTYVESGLGISAKRLKAPEAFMHFAVTDGELYMHDEGRVIPEEVIRLCRVAGETTIWGDGIVLRWTKIKSWLEHGFALAELGAQKAVGPHLVRINDERLQWRWVPQLPRTIGKTRDQVQREAEAETMLHSKRGRRRINKAFVWVSPVVV
ncbi:HNH endonuclease [Undibacterium crateris]|uniref:HNH endonuclease n=1 Tax=Undibacterium crateris TaxID=2528175 RepID=UPI00138A2D90|nr:HNH endonuclease signature motif containing protein [Undibacterium crateris]NDI85478.1 hypothetical protein [Undibacterium crateris]